MNAAADHAALGNAIRDARGRVRLTQEEVARKCGVSVRTLYNLEHGRIAAPRWSTLRALANALRVEEEVLAQLTEGALEGAPNGQLHVRQYIVPPLTPLIGRDAEREQVTRRLASEATRLLTLTGPAGIGKTRLAAAVARTLSEQDEHVWWVPLSAITRTDLVVSTIADAVSTNAATTAAIAARLQRLTMSGSPVVVIDNLEHLDGVGHVIHELLVQVPALTVLATSRAPLRITGEYEWPLAPLAMPGPEDDTPQRAGAVPSTALLVERIQQAVPGFVLDQDNLETVVAVCHEVGGLPLALELAAAQWRVRGGSEVLRSLRTDPLAVREVTDDGAPSLRQALTATLELLTPETRRVLQQLAVFAGGWTWDAAVAVTDTTALVADIDRLTALGLVQTDDVGTERRFQMLPVIKALALSEASEALRGAAAERHASWHAQQAARDGVSLERSRGARLMLAFDVERDNLRAALDWLGQHDPEAGLRLACSLRRYWQARGHLAEGVARVETLCESVGDPSLVAEGRGEAALMAYALGRFNDAMAWAEEALADARQQHDTTREARALLSLGCIHLEDPAVAEAYEREALAAADRDGDPFLQCWASVNLGVSLTEQGSLKRAEPVNERAADLAHAHGYLALEVLAVSNLAEAAQLRDDGTSAAGFLDTIEPQLAEIDDVGIRTAWAAQSAIAHASTGDLGRARRLLAYAHDCAARAQINTKEAVVHQAEGELAFANGALAEAANGFRGALDMPMQYGGPVWRAHVLARLAEATDDSVLQVRALAQADEIRRSQSVQFPRAIEQRLDALRVPEP